jgi:hypothetical protein
MFWRRVVRANKVHILSKVKIMCRLSQDDNK